MAYILIPETTAAVTSPRFTAGANQFPNGILSWGLAGAETMTVYRDRGNGVMVALTEISAIMTATSTSTAIVASGTYEIRKTATASPAGVSID